MSLGRSDDHDNFIATRAQPTVAVPEADLRALEGCLNGHPGVHETIVIARRDRQQQWTIVAYVVATGPVTVEPLRERARRAGMALLPGVVVRISSVPLSERGEIDSEALLALPIADEHAIATLENALRASPAIVDVRVVAEWPLTPEPELRLDDLLSDESAINARSRSERPAPLALDPRSAPSLAVGPAIEWDDVMPGNLGALLDRAVERWPTQTITCVDQRGEQVFTYADLRDRAERIMAGLRASGVRPGQAVIFQFEDNADFLASFWGCALGGFVPAPIAVPPTADVTGAAAVKLGNAWQLFGRPAILTSASLESRLSTVCGAWTPVVPLLLIVERVLEGADARQVWHDSAPDDAALYLLTSGSTGVPKAVIQTHGALVGAARAMAQRNAFSTADACLNWISLEHVGGIVMCHLMFVAMGARQVQVRTDYILQDVLRWLNLIDRYRATFTWAPNFAFALVNDRSDDVRHRRWDLSSMRFIVNGGEAVVAKTARRFLRLLAPLGLPGTAIRPAWGMSETSSAAVFSDAFDLESTSDADDLVEVGAPNPGFEVRIVDDRAQIVPEGYGGRLEVRGRSVTRGYFNNPSANAESFTADGWFRTGDLGTLRSGRLTITGREKGVIIINGVNYYAHEVEAAVEELDGTTPSFTAAFAVRESTGNTDALVVALHTPFTSDAQAADLVRRVRMAVRERVGVVPRHLLLVGKDDIPKTDIGKIQRQALIRRFEDGGFAGELARFERLTEQAETVPDWFFRPAMQKRLLSRHRPLGPATTVVCIGVESGPLLDELEKQVVSTGARFVSRTRGDAGGVRATVQSVEIDERLVIVLPMPRVSEDATVAVEAAMARVALELTELVALLTDGPRRAAACEILSYDDQTGSRHPAAFPIRASIVALLRTVAAEHPLVAVRHIAPPTSDAQSTAATLLGEIGDRSDEPEVLYRGEDRFVRRLVRQAPVGRGHPVFGSGNGFLLVTGALGGTGFEVCRHLLLTSGQPMLLVGRRPLSASSDAQRSAFARLQELGVVEFEAADVADYDTLEQVIEAGCRRWGRALDGILHLAGVFEPRLLAAETSVTLADAFRAKVAGSWNIHRLLMSRPDVALIGFSSVNGLMGGYAAGAYAMANAFLDGLVHYHAEVLGRRAYSLAWSLWDGIGMSGQFALEEAARRRGYRALTVRQGILSLMAVAASDPGHVLIGLDSRHPDIRRYLSAEPLVEEPTAYCVYAAGAAEIPPPVVTDAFGVSLVSHLHRVDDLAAAGGNSGPAVSRRSPSAQAPVWDNRVEQQIAAAWREVLPDVVIGPDDNFFEIGGTSVNTATASRLLEQALGREVAMTDLYRYPTIRLLATHFSGAGTADAADLDHSEDRGEARRAARQQRLRPR